MEFMHRNESPVESNGRLYSLKITLIAGPVTCEFARSNPEVSRIIEIPGDHTLKDLHAAIFRAFNRSIEREYEFQVDGKEYSPGQKCFLPVSQCRDITGAIIPSGDAGKTRLDELEFSPGDIFYYWFDFTNDWMHRILILSIGDTHPEKEYPAVTGKVGDSPPQKPDWDRVLRI
jgi:hypothetical protein